MMRALRALALFTLLAAEPLTAQLPAPASVLGYEVGADFELANYEQSLEYFQRLAAASDRVELREVGRTSFGRPWYVAFVSSAENIRNLSRHQEIARRLADPADDMTDEEARALATEGKAMVWIDGGLHATEVAHAQHTIQLAYDLVTRDDDPETRAILDNVILLLWFSINPDGQTMVSDWYYQNLGTPFEVSGTPFLYQKYIGHDNNRDGYMINQIESRVVTRVAREWEPQIICVLARYGENGSPLLSGYFLGEEHVQGYAAALDVKHGDGRVVLLGLRPQWRGQPFGTFKVLFNAALYSSEVAARTPDNSAFWTAPVIPNVERSHP